MAKDLSLLTREELGHLFPISISKPIPEWKNLFLQEKSNIIALLGEKTALRVEHIGSTAVPNLLAKPTIDILVEIPKSQDLNSRITSIMELNGYNYIHEQKDHLMFVKGYTPDGFKGQSYHIHMGTREDTGLWNRLHFRDYLISNPSIAYEYAVLKQNLASKYQYDRDAYTEAKTGFINRITQLSINTLK